jgi:energy-coupling factor transport system ATP-binding protein
MPPDELLCSGILKEKGIREPLYITAAKHAGLTITPRMKPAHIETIEIAPNAAQLEAWSKNVEKLSGEKRPEPALRLENVDFSYDEKRRVLTDVSFDIRKGEMVSIVGKNGAGKSTIARLVCGFEKEDTGAIYLDGENIKDMTIKERSGKVGLIMQNPNQMITQPMIEDEVGLALALTGVEEKKKKKRIQDALEICGLKPFIKWPVSALSYGQKKRVTIASILVMEPSVLMLDEPTAGQDYRHYTEIMEFLRKLNKSGMTIILITHDMHLMLEYTPRAIALADGRIIADSSAADILTNEEVIRKANLKETSLYTLAARAGITDAAGFVNSFIDYEKAAKSK